MAGGAELVEAVKVVGEEGGEDLCRSDTRYVVILRKAVVLSYALEHIGRIIVEFVVSF